MSVLFSQEFSLDSDILNKLGVFDAIIDSDSSFFINLKRLQYTEVEEFRGAYTKINEYFRNIGLLLKTATDEQHKNYRTAFKMFDFPEVNGINLGFSWGRAGSGFGPQLRKAIIRDAYDIIKTGSEQPEIFHLTSLFEENVGPDRISDMIARLVYENIISYTKNRYQELGLSQDSYPTYTFKDSLIMNPYKECPILLLPQSILQELPIARNWDDIDRVCHENEAIRAEINEEVAKEWSKMPSGDRKEYLKNYIFKNPEKVKRLIKAYDEIVVPEVRIENNTEYLIEKVVAILDKDKTVKENISSSFDASMEIINEYKNWVEQKKGYSVIQEAKSQSVEKIVQRTLHGSATYFCKINNLDISPESNTGRGPVDFKISRGTDKTVIEIKLSTNNDSLHGFEVQIEEYAKSEGTDQKIFLLVDNGGPTKNITAVQESYKNKRDKGENPAEVVIIDAREKQSASKYKPK